MSALNIYYKAIGITNLGVGTRAVYWLQGCSIGCSGCLAKDSQSFEVKNYIPVVELIEELKNSQIDLEGVTISGGEPFDQKKSLSIFLKKIKEEFKNFSIMLFTGYDLDDLLKRDDEDINSIIKHLDIIIDGKFDQNRRISEPWRGSSNQTIYFLTDKYSIDDYKKEKIGTDFIIKDGEVFEVGIPKKD